MFEVEKKTFEVDGLTIAYTETGPKDGRVLFVYTHFCGGYQPCQSRARNDGCDLCVALRDVQYFTRF